MASEYARRKAQELATEHGAVEMLAVMLDWMVRGLLIMAGLLLVVVVLVAVIVGMVIG